VFGKKNKIITGLDIGTDKIKILVASKEDKDSDSEVLFSGKRSSVGMRRGVVVKPDELSEEINSLVEEAENSIGCEISSVISNINGSHIDINSSRGMIVVSRADKEISQEDVNRVVQNAQAINPPSNREIIDFFPKEFTVDGEAGIKEVLGMKGIRLEADVLLLSALSPYLQNLNRSIVNADLQIDAIKYSSIAAAESVLTNQQKELGVALVDIGAETTGLVVFEEERLIHVAVFPIGSNNITKDIAIVLKCDIDLAEKIKREFGACMRIKSKKGRYKKKKIEISDSLSFSEKILIDVIEARVSEIFDQVDKELKKISRQKLLPAGVVLVGGGAKIPKIKSLARKELKLPCRIGTPNGFIGLDKDPSLATVCGLVMDKESYEGYREGGFFSDSRGKISKIKKFFRIFIP
jgi:cell division protein FtsA